MLGIPVAANAFKDTGPVVQGMGHQAEASVLVMFYLPVQVDPVLGLLLTAGFGGLCQTFRLDRHEDDLLFAL